MWFAFSFVRLLRIWCLNCVPEVTLDPAYFNLGTRPIYLATSPLVPQFQLPQATLPHTSMRDAILVWFQRQLSKRNVLMESTILFHRHVFLHFSSSCFFDSLWKSFARICTVSGVAQCNASNQLPHLRCRRSHRRHSLQGKQFQGEATRSGNRNTCECLVTAKEFDHLSECGCWAKVLLVANLEILYYVQFQYQEYRLSHKGFPIHHPKPCLCWHAFGHGRHRLPDCIIPVTVTAKNRTEFLCGVCGHTCNSGPGIAGGSWSVCLVDAHFAREQQKDAAP